MAEVISLKTRRPIIAERPRPHPTYAEETDIGPAIGLRNAVILLGIGWVSIYWLAVGLKSLAETVLTALGWG